MKKKLFSFAQLIIGVGLIAFIFYNMKDKGDLADAIRDAAGHWGWLLAGAMGFLVCFLVCALRWKLFLEAQGLHLSFRLVLTYFFVGHFFNSILFGVTGGDVVKAYFAAGESSHKKTEAVTTVFIDRIIGLLALIGLTVVIMTARLPFFLAHKETRLALMFNVAMLVGTVTALFVVFRRNVFDRWAFFRRLGQESMLGRIMARAYAAFHVCLKHPGLLLKTLLLSAANHIMLVVSAFWLGLALEIHVRFLDYLSVFPVINAVAAIPLTPGGLGTREMCAKFLLGVVGVPETRAVTLSLLLYTLMLAWSFVGGIVFLWHTYRRGLRPRGVVEAVDVTGG